MVAFSKLQDLGARLVGGLELKRKVVTTLLSDAAADGREYIEPQDVHPNASFFVTFQYGGTVGDLKIADIDGVDETIPAGFLPAGTPHPFLATKLYNTVTNPGGTNEILVGVA